MASMFGISSKLIQMVSLSRVAEVSAALVLPARWRKSRMARRTQSPSARFAQDVVPWIDVVFGQCRWLGPIYWVSMVQITELALMTAKKVRTISATTSSLLQMQEETNPCDLNV